MLRKTGAPTCVGDRLTAYCLSTVGSVVLPADINALASARSGTRSKNNPAPPRTSVRRDSVGDHATPTRGETLFVSVLIVSSHCRSYRTPALSVTSDVTVHSSC